MSRRARLMVFGAGALGLVLLFALAGRALAPSGHARSPTGDLLARLAVPERHATDAVAAVTFDYRGFDTLGEEFILFGSVLGATALLRDERRHRKTKDEGARVLDRGRLEAPVRLVAFPLVAVTVVFGLYLVAHGQQTPGGGFQGGVLLSTAPLLAYLATTPETLPRIAPQWFVELGEAAGTAGFLVVGLAGSLVAGAFLQNVLPLGQPGRLASAGTIAVLNLTTGLAVAGGLLTLLSSFLRKTREQDQPGDET